MEGTIFAEISRELKGLHNTAFKLINEGRLNEAEAYYTRILDITSYLHYYEGMALAYYNLANLEILRANELLALKKLVLAQELYQQAGVESDECEESIQRLARKMMEMGIAYEGKGELKKALSFYQACRPYVSKNHQDALCYEIDLLQEVITNAETINRRNSDKIKSTGHRKN
ncbi:MAG: hypothetical protein ACQEQG_09620 [Bacillota bacterium]